MPAKQYTEYKKEIDGDWTAQHPKTDPEQIESIISKIDFSTAPGFSKVPGYANKLIYNAVGRFCWVTFTLKGLTKAQTWCKIATLPQGYRPKEKNAFPGAEGVRKAFQTRIDPDGSVYVWSEIELIEFSCWGFYYLD